MRTALYMLLYCFRVDFQPFSSMSGSSIPDLLKSSQTPLRMSKALKAWQDISDCAALKSPYYLADF